MYAGLGEYERKNKLLKKKIEEYVPTNDQKEMVHQVLEDKLQEMMNVANLNKGKIDFMHITR